MPAVPKRKCNGLVGFILGQAGSWDLIQGSLAVRQLEILLVHLVTQAWAPFAFLFLEMTGILSSSRHNRVGL